MKKIIFIFFIFLLSSLAFAQGESFFMLLTLGEEALTVDALELHLGEAPQYPLEEEDTYLAQLMTFNGTEQMRFSFSLDQTFVHSGDIPEVISLGFSLPYSREAKEIVIREQMTGNLFQVIDLTPLQSCNFDSFCDILESDRTCPEDCAILPFVPTQQFLQDKMRENLLITKDEILSQEESSSQKLLIVFIFLGIALFVALGVFLKRKIYK